MLGGFSRDQRPPRQAESPTDVLVGRCPTCRSVIEVSRSAATPPSPGPNGRPGSYFSKQDSAEAGGFGAWFELWSVECPVCTAATAKVTAVDGRVQQERVGPRVYLTKRE